MQVHLIVDFISSSSPDNQKIARQYATALLALNGGGYVDRLQRDQQILEKSFFDFLAPSGASKVLTNKHEEVSIDLNLLKKQLILNFRNDQQITKPEEIDSFIGNVGKIFDSYKATARLVLDWDSPTDFADMKIKNLFEEIIRMRRLEYLPISPT